MPEMDNRCVRPQNSRFQACMTQSSKELQVFKSPTFKPIIETIHTFVVITPDRKQESAKLLGLDIRNSRSSVACKKRLFEVFCPTTYTLNEQSSPARSTVFRRRLQEVLGRLLAIKHSPTTGKPSWLAESLMFANEPRPYNTIAI